MNYMKEIAEMLGLEWDDEKRESEEFTVKANPYHSSCGIHKLNVLGLQSNYNNYTGDLLLCRLLIGELKIKKLPWEPKEGEIYWFPTIDSKCLAHCTHYNNSYDYHKLRIERGMAFKTEAEAVAKAEEILKLIKEK